MIVLYLIAFVAGLVVGISPCILPVLPVIFVAGITTPVRDSATTTEKATRSYRAYAVIGGLVLSFCTFTLVGSELLSALHLPQDLLRDAGLVILGVVAVGLLIPALGDIVERPFARLGSRHQPSGNTSAFVLGLGLGVLFTPCAGPILSAITVVSANHKVGLTSVILTADFALGAAIPLLAFALAGQKAASAFRAHAPLARQIGGGVLAVMTVVLGFHWTDGLVTHVPGYTTALQRSIEGNDYARKHLQALEGTGGGRVADCHPNTALVHCGPAPAFTGIHTWLNTPDGKPLTLAALRGRVVLIDFWTYSCINCQRALPHVEAWYSRYRGDGLEVIGVHTPEFAFEHVVSNIVTASQQLGVHYPVAVDNGYKTWDAYSNMYWPAEYLIDATGQVRHVAFGEGDYGATESLIRSLLVAADPTVHLPGATGVPNRTPHIPVTPETYLGYKYQLPNIANPPSAILPDRPSSYQFPSSLPPGAFALAGTWTVGSENVTAGAAAQIELSFQADNVYLVLGGSGTLGVAVNGKHTQTITVSGTPRLYTLVKGGYQAATVTLSASPGIQAYDFTFG